MVNISGCIGIFILTGKDFNPVLEVPIRHKTTK